MSGGADKRGGTLLLVGTGLVGGSFALAAKAHGVFDRVVGIDDNPEALRQALELGIVDETTDASDVVCDAACIAVPVGAVADWVQEAAKTAPLVFDVGSVKRPIIDALYPLPPNYVPCHPIAGSEARRTRGRAPRPLQRRLGRLDAGCGNRRRGDRDRARLLAGHRRHGVPRDARKHTTSAWRW